MRAKPPTPRKGAHGRSPPRSSAPGRIDRIAVALAARGPDGAVCRLADDAGITLEVAVRAVIPVVNQVADDRGEAVAAIAVDGIASITALDAAHATVARAACWTATSRMR